MKKIIVVFAILALGMTACATSTTSSAGTKVNVAGGSYTNVTSAQLKTMLAQKDFYFVNVHIPYEGEIEKTDAFIPYDKIGENLSNLPADKNAKIFLYCRSGNMSTIASEELVKRGYTNLWHLPGGMIDWERAGFTLIRK